MLKLATFEDLLRFVGAFDHHIVNPATDYLSECNTVLVHVFRSKKSSNSAIHKAPVELLERWFVEEFTKTFSI